jgi:hypothetical protein
MDDGNNGHNPGSCNSSTFSDKRKVEGLKYYTRLIYSRKSMLLVYHGGTLGIEYQGHCLLKQTGP